MTVIEMCRKLLLLPPYMEVEFISEAGVTDIGDAELEDFTARLTIARYQGYDAGNRPRLQVLLPAGLRTITRVDQELADAFEEIRRMQDLLDAAQDASFVFAKGPGAVSSPMWGIVGEVAP